MAGWRLERGATIDAAGAAHFAVWAPRAERVEVRFPGSRDAAPLPLQRDRAGVFTGTAPGVGPGADYAYCLDGGRERPDPVSRAQPSGVHGPSRIVDPLAFRWTDGSWRGIAAADLVLYELHVGTFTAAGTFDGVVERLRYLRDLGVTAIELMPVSQFPGARNWGYDGVFPYAPQWSYGGPEGLRRLVDAAHAAGLAVVLDVVYNHLGPEGNVLHDFGPYFSDQHRTPWGSALNFDGPDSDEVRRFFIDNALYWIAEFHLDGLRLDAVHAIVDLGARHILEELTAAVHALGTALGRRVLVIAESALNDPRIVRPVERGGFGLDGQWNDDFHHAVHGALTGERDGYYGDYGGVAPVAKALAERFVLDGCYSAFRRRRHGAPATDVPADRFVIALQTHDQVGNRARGERLASLVEFEQLKLAAALLLLAPYVPLLFMGEEYGETNPFLYFVSHEDPALLEAVRSGRRREFADFDWRDVPDPAAADTFARSRLSWSLAAPERAGLRRLYGDLLTLRRRERALRPGVARAQVASDSAAWVTLALRAGRSATWACFNLRGEPAAVPQPRGRWRRVLATGARRYHGGARLPRRRGATLEVPAWSAALYRRESVR